MTTTSTTTTTTTTDIDSVFVSNGGRVACHRHLGHYATAELRRRPNARTISTPLDVWGRVDQIDVDAEDWAWMNCESCPTDETTDDAFSVGDEVEWIGSSTTGIIRDSRGGAYGGCEVEITASDTACTVGRYVFAGAAALRIVQ